ncbi:unnamed protein product [Dovyalis caffra]|uniref:CCHC-type domain-containing protein n=1 Tax=Dovyalis caffra TaxID=77055 RepID=A0AAV1SPK7_9ROSI|nr:unnamed protein product [Dovyalis caffra]
MAIFFDRSDRSSGDDSNASGENVRPCGLCLESNMVLRKNRFRQLEIPPGFNVNHLGKYGPMNKAVDIFQFHSDFSSMLYALDHVLSGLCCIGGCDETLRQMIEICGTGFRSQAIGRPTTTTPSNRPTTTTPSNLQRSNSRQAPCIYCYQTGHASTDCPTQISAARRVQFRGMNQQNGSIPLIPALKGLFVMQENLQFHVARVEPHVFCERLTQQITGEESSTRVRHKRATSSWEDNLNNGTVPRSAPRLNISNPSGRGGRGRGVQNAGRASDVTFVSATGEPISGRRCFVCGDPSHFANACPNRGS